MSGVLESGRPPDAEATEGMHTVERRAQRSSLRSQAGQLPPRHRLKFVPAMQIESPQATRAGICTGIGSWENLL